MRRAIVASEGSHHPGLLLFQVSLPCPSLMCFLLLVRWGFSKIICFFAPLWPTLGVCTSGSDLGPCSLFFLSPFAACFAFNRACQGFIHFFSNSASCLTHFEGTVLWSHSISILLDKHQSTFLDSLLWSIRVPTLLPQHGWNYKYVMRQHYINSARI